MNQKTILRSVLAAVLSLVATTATAHDFEVDGIYYNNNGDGTVSVTFKGSSYNEYADEYTGDVVIPSSVTYNERPYSVTSIDGFAFSDCSGLTSVSIPNSVSSIGGYAFYGCSGLTSVTIPNSVSEIGGFAFYDCSGLTRVDISNLEAWLGIKFSDLYNNPLYYAHHLYLNGEEVKDLVIPNSVKSIGENAFEGCSGLTSVTIPNSVNSIGDSAFYGCSGLTSVTIPNSVTSIGDWAFNGCSGLTSVTIPNSVTSIGDNAFQDCSGLTSVTIPNSVTSIGNFAFSECSGLESIVVESGNSTYDSRDNCNAIIETATNTLLAGCKNTTIPNSVTSIGNFAFSKCSGLTSVTIGNSVTSIGDEAFRNCSGLTSVTIPNSVTSIGEYAFAYCSNLKTIFYNAKKCADVTADSHVFDLRSYDLNIIIGKDVEEVPNYLFYFLENAPARVISQSVTPPTCGAYTFNSYVNTAKLYVPNEDAVFSYQIADVWRYFYFDIATVDNPLTSIALSDSEATIDLGSTKQLTATATPSDATIADIFEWSSSNPEVAVVDGNGLVSAVGEGTTVITAKALDGSNLEATCVVTVYPVAENVNQLKPGTNKVNFGLQGVKMHDGVLYACTTAKSVNESTPTFHSNDAGNMAPYEDRNFANFDQRDWVAISGLEDGFVGKELSYPFVATFAEGVLTPSGTITTTADATAYNLNTFRAENILHGGYSNYAEGNYKAYYVPARVNEVAKFMGLIKTVGGVKYLYSNNAYGHTDGEGIKIEGNIADNSEVYSLLEGILVADASTKAGVKIIMLQDLGEATDVEGVDTAATRSYTANGNIIIAATEDGEAAVYDFTGRLIKSVPVASGNSSAVPVAPGCYIVKTGTKTQSVIVK